MKNKTNRALVCAMVVIASSLGAGWFFLAPSLRTFKQTDAPVRLSVPQLLGLAYDLGEHSYDGFSLSTQEREELVAQGGAPTYGEITFEGADTLFRHLKPTSQDVFYDFGSGVGKLVLQAYFQTPVHRSVGIELARRRFQTATTALEKLMRVHLIGSPRSVDFRCEDVLNASCDDATIIFMNSTCFSDSMMQALAKKMDQLAHLKTIVSQKSLPQMRNFYKERELVIPMTWNPTCQVSIYKKRAKL